MVVTCTLTPSISSAESVVSLIEASSMKSYGSFKDWIEPILFVIKGEEYISAIIKPVIIIDDIVEWPDARVCADCKDGEEMRRIIDPIDWIGLKSGTAVSYANLVCNLV